MAHTENSPPNVLRGKYASLARGACAAIACLPLVGCQKNPTVRVVAGTVTIEGVATPESGRITLVPLDASASPASHAQIVGGRYRIEARGGVLPGRYRVQVEAEAKTGRSLTAEFRGEWTEVDERRSIVPPEYSSPQSPLVVVVPLEGSETLDVRIPGL